LFVLVEKILAAHENLPPDWPVAGTTGYEFGNDVNGLLLESAGLREIHKIYVRFTGQAESFDEVVHRSKLLILRVSMSSELQMLATRLNRISEQHRRSRDFTLNSLRLVLREIMACFPLYRTYPRPSGLSDRDRSVVNQAVAQARRRNPAFDAALFEFVRQVLLLEHPEGLSEDARRQREVFTGRFQQVTSALMAKGVEDTAFYLHFPLASLNEVGGHPSHAALQVADFHRHNARRQVEHPRSLLATSTHDTKRSEDVRARLQVLSERPHNWRTALNRWARFNRRFVREVDGMPAPSRNDEYLFYQTLVGIWPAGEPTPQQRQSLVERLQRYMAKATHEAKARTSWINPNAAYDEAVANFVARTLEPRRDNRFLAELPRFVADLAGFGYLNALSQTTLKLLSPGVPDTYQGQELWDFSLVDPDNRRPVDYDLRRKLLAELQTAESAGPQALLELVRALAGDVSDPRTKLFVTWKSLGFRRDHRDLCTLGEYIPLSTAGEFADHVCAFAWKHSPENQPPAWAIVVVPRLLARLADHTASPSFPPLGPAAWRDTTLSIPAGQSHCFTNVFTGQTLSAIGSTIPVAEVLSEFPVALLRA
jgi:(1->4)-alpha-D-glucan 1-alpha-D-glucosylmutase